MTNKSEQIWRSLRDAEFRRQFIDEHIDVGIALQIRALRERQVLTQAKLAELLGDKKNQPVISSWEDPSYGKYTLTTLKDLAKAFDVGLLVRFVPFSKLVDWTTDLTGDLMAPANFTYEDKHHDLFVQINQVASTADRNHFPGPTPDEPQLLSSAESQPYEYAIKKGGMPPYA